LMRRQIQPVRLRVMFDYRDQFWIHGIPCDVI
jgi:hypothetical protein